MQVERDTVVRFHYELSDESGAALESSRDGEGLAVLYGYRNIVPGLEDALGGRAAGDRFTVTVAPERAYGLRQDGWTRRVSKKHLLQKKKPVVGETVTIRLEGGVREVTVTKVGATVVDVDLNHPMAGQTLVFDIEVLEVRPAEPAELAHGHAHHAGGHDH